MASRGDNVGMLANRARRILAEQRRTLMEIDLSGKVALVTGGSRGLGREMVLAFARRGADVVIASRSIDTCEEVADEVRRETGRQALPVACHVGRWDDLERLTDAAYDEFGRVDVLVNNAGMAPVYPSLVEVSEELFDKVVAVNLKGPFRLSALVGARMVAGDGGSMINVSSIAAQRPQVHDIPYAAAKAGLEHDDARARDGARPDGAGQLRDGRAVPHRHLQGVGPRELRGVRQEALPARPARRAARDRRHRAVPGVGPVELHHRHGAHRRRRRVGLVAVPDRGLAPRRSTESEPTMQLQDKVAVITGGTQGIGQGIAATFLAEGASVPDLRAQPDKGDGRARRSSAGAIARCSSQAT